MALRTELLPGYLETGCLRLIESATRPAFLPLRRASAWMAMMSSVSLRDGNGIASGGEVDCLFSRRRFFSMAVLGVGGDGGSRRLVRVEICAAAIEHMVHGCSD